MQCTSPYGAKSADGWIIDVPCGQCLNCRISHKQTWVGRCLLEARHQPSSFLTLTYDEEHVLKDLDYSFPQKFMKRLRSKGFKGKFICKGEYGETTGRPHWHYLIFGRDQEFDGWGEMPEWKFGSVYDAPVNSATAGYVMGYNLLLDEKKEDRKLVFSSGNRKGQHNAIGADGFREIGEVLANRGFAIAPGNYNIRGKWYPMGNYGKKVAESHAISLGALEVPKQKGSDLSLDRAIRLRETDLETRTEQAKEGLEFLHRLYPMNTNNRKAAERGKKLKGRTR